MSTSAKAHGPNIDSILTEKRSFPPPADPFKRSDFSRAVSVCIASTPVVERGET